MGDSEKGSHIAEVENPPSAYDEPPQALGKKEAIAPVDGVDGVDGAPVRSRLEPPEFLRNMSLEEREHLETKLKRKIDLRLMPGIILMYILNYIDRCGIPLSPASCVMHKRNAGLRFADAPLETTSPLRDWPAWNRTSISLRSSSTLPSAFSSSGMYSSPS